MAKFYLGQRVKKVRGKNNIGQAATVVEYCDFGPGDKPFGWIEPCGEPKDIVVLFNEPWLCAANQPQPASRRAVCNSANFEPIVPEGMGSAEELERLFGDKPCAFDERPKEKAR